MHHFKARGGGLGTCDTSPSLALVSIHENGPWLALYIHPWSKYQHPSITFWISYYWLYIHMWLSLLTPWFDYSTHPYDMTRDKSLSPLSGQERGIWLGHTGHTCHAIPYSTYDRSAPLLYCIVTACVFTSRDHPSRGFCKYYLYVVRSLLTDYRLQTTDSQVRAYPPCWSSLKKLHLPKSNLPLLWEKLWSTRSTCVRSGNTFVPVALCLSNHMPVPPNTDCFPTRLVSGSQWLCYIAQPLAFSASLKPAGFQDSLSG